MATALGEFTRTRSEQSTTNGHRPRRISPSVLLARWLARHLPRLAAVRTLLLHVLAAACLVYGVFLVLGLGAMFVTLAAVLLLGDWWLTAEADGP